jgi:hypothetical protein
MLNTVFRWSGLLMIVGAALMGAALVLVSVSPDTGASALASPFVSVPLLLSSILLLLALPAMYARQAEAAGWLGLTGHALLEMGFLLFVSVASTPLRFPPGVTTVDNGVDFFFGIALGLGFLVTALATVRAGVYPRGAGLLLLGAAAGFFFDFFVSELLPRPVGQLGTAVLAILLALGFAWVGLAIVKGAGARSAGGIPKSVAPVGR